MKEEVSSVSDKVQSVSVDPNLPTWACQNCRHSLCFLGVDSYAENFLIDSSFRPGQGASVQAAGSMFNSTRMDNSYIVLPKQKIQTPVLPHRSHGVDAQRDNQSGKTIEDSFVVLPPAAASLYNYDNGAGTRLSPLEESDNNPSQSANVGFFSTTTILKKAFDIATNQIQVAQPLCIDCMRVLSDKLDKEVEDVNRDIQAYEACLQCLEKEVQNSLSESDFLEEKMKIEEEEKRLTVEILEIERQCEETDAELKEIELRSNRFKELEERYWQEFNNYEFQLITYQDERDAILSKIEVCQAHLERLKKTNVLTDAFPISHDGEFGTINNFRLGRLPKIHVEWDEINAAWGQSCLLLHTMAHYFKPKFQYRIKIVPMGSYSRIIDVDDDAYELFGPVNLFWSTRYDKAMTLFLTCLKEFSEFANSKDRENNIHSEKCFRLPYKIENDKVGSFSITQSFHKQENYTKALKYTLCNLKWALYWFVGNSSFQPLSSSPSSSAASATPPP